MAPRRAKMAPKRAKIAPRRPQDAAKTAQDASKTAQDAPGRSQDAAKTAQDAPKKPPRRLLRYEQIAVARVWRFRGVTGSTFSIIFQKQAIIENQWKMITKNVENVEPMTPRKRQMRATSTLNKSKRLWLQFGASEASLARRFPLFY